MELLINSGVRPSVVEYLAEPPDAETILRLATLLNLRVSELLRRGEAEFATATDLPDLDDDGALAAWIEKNPKVLQRPIVVDEEHSQAVIGRPPENVLPLLPQ